MKTITFYPTRDINGGFPAPAQLSCALDQVQALHELTQPTLRQYRVGGFLVQGLCLPADALTPLDDDLMGWDMLNVSLTLHSVTITLCDLNGLTLDYVAAR